MIKFLSLLESQLTLRYNKLNQMQILNLKKKVQIFSNKKKIFFFFCYIDYIMYVQLKMKMILK